MKQPRTSACNIPEASTQYARWWWIVLCAGICTVCAVFIINFGRPNKFVADVAFDRCGVAQLFYDRGTGYSAADSSIQEVTHFGSLSHLEFSLPDGDFRGFRFDPNIAECRVVIYSARVIDPFGRVIVDLGHRVPQPGSQIESLSQRDGRIFVQSIRGATDPSVLYSDLSGVRLHSLPLQILKAILVIVFGGMFRWLMHKLRFVSELMNRDSIYWLVAFGIVILSWLFRIVHTGFSIYGSDEYVYLGSGIRWGVTKLMTGDVGVGLSGNHIYSAYVHLVHAYFDSPVLCMRFVNFFAYAIFCVGGAGFAYRRIGGGATGMYLLILCLLVLPGSLYILSPMPEIMLLSICCMTMFGVVIYKGRFEIVVACAAGLVLAAALYVKPHAMGIIAGVGAYYLFAVVFGRNIVRRLIVLFGFVFCIVLGVFISNAIFAGEWSLRPAFIGSGYGGYLRQAGSTISFIERFLGVGRYFVAHLFVLVFLFPFAWSFFFRRIMVLIKNHESLETRRDVAFSFILLFSTFAMLALVSQFTFSASTLDVAGEGGRLHGRYLFVLFPGFVMASIFGFQDLMVGLKSIGRRVLSVVCAIAFLGALALIPILGFRIFPWDYPDLFFLTELTHVEIMVFIALAVGVVIIVSVRPRIFAAAVASFFLFILCFSSWSVGTWQARHAAGKSHLYEAGRCLRMIGSADCSDILILTDDRGEVSYVLSGLLAMPEVHVVAPGATTSAAVIGKEIRHVAVLGDCRFECESAKPYQIGALTIYDIGTTGK